MPIKPITILVVSLLIASGILVAGPGPTARVHAQDQATAMPTGPHIWFHDDFSTRANRWRIFNLGGKSSIGFEIPDQPQTTGLDVKAQAANYPMWTIPDSDLKPDHFIMTAMFSLLEGGDDARAGMIINYRSENDMFVVAVSRAKQVYVGRFYFGVWTDIIPPAQADFDPDQPVTLRATLSEDRTVAVAVNGTDAGQTTIKDLKAAGFGLFALTGQQGGIKAVFRSLVVSDL